MFRRSTKNNFTNPAFNIRKNNKITTEKEAHINSFFINKEEKNNIFKEEQNVLRVALVDFEKNRDLNEFFNDLGEYKKKYVRIYILQKIDRFFENNKVPKTNYFDIKEILNEKEIKLFKNFIEYIIYDLKKKTYILNLKYIYLLKGTMFDRERIKEYHRQNRLEKQKELNNDSTNELSTQQKCPA